MSEIKITKLCKRYGKNNALCDVDLTLRENCIYGLLGRNGAGKTTLLNILSGRAFPTSGEVTVDGQPLAGNDNALGKIFMMSEQLLFDPEIRVSKMFKITADLYSGYDMEYAIKLSESYGLDCKKRMQSLSTGYKTIAKIINALACGAPVVFFDEPVLGLDANHREMFYRHVIERYTSHPATYVISTHLIEEAATFIERAVIIKEGRLIMDEETEEIRKMGYTISGKASEVDGYIASLTGDFEILSTENIGGLKTASIKGKPARDTMGNEITPLSLQSMFVCLTSGNDGKEDVK